MVEIVKNFIARLSKLYVEYGDFLEWKKERTTVGIVEQKENVESSAEEGNKIVPSKLNLKGNTTI